MTTVTFTANGAEPRSCPNTVADWPGDRTSCLPVPLTEVEVTGFLGEKIDKNLESILKGLESPIPRGFEARAEGRELPKECNRLAADSDLYKWLEGACYVYARTGDANVRSEIDRIAGLIVQRQEEDGYINTQVPPWKRFDPKVNHDLYIAGHFFEAAVAHFRATGSRDLLDTACRWGDYLIKEFEAGNPYYEKVGKREHSEYELGFLRLSRVTGQSKYLDFAIALAQMCKVGPKVSDVKAGAGNGLHAVRVAYLLSGCADLYLETGRDDLFQHLSGLWDELVATRMYLTGGLGMVERIPKEPFDLPQFEEHKDRDIAETCGSVAMMMFSWRMHSISGDSRYYDVIENILYNHYLGAIAEDNLGAFYYNPLRVVGDQSGQTDAGGPKTTRVMLPKIHRTTCCISNSWRFFGALPEYLFSCDDDGVFVNLYSDSRVRHELPDGRQIDLSITTKYPHDGSIVIRFEGKSPTEFAARLRIPAWCFNGTVCIPGEEKRAVSGGDYFTVKRAWNPGDEVALDLDMPIRLVFSDPRIHANSGQVAIARGPLVYCLEDKDNDFPLEQACLDIPPESIADRAKVEWREDLLGGVNVIHLPGKIAPSSQQAEWMRPYYSVAQDTELVMIPFYARANRGEDNRWTTLVPYSGVFPQMATTDLQATAEP